MSFYESHIQNQIISSTRLYFPLTYSFNFIHSKLRLCVTSKLNIATFFCTPLLAFFFSNGIDYFAIFKSSSTFKCHCFEIKIEFSSIQFAMLNRCSTHSKVSRRRWLLANCLTLYLLYRLHKYISM